MRSIACEYLEPLQAEGLKRLLPNDSVRCFPLKIGRSEGDSFTPDLALVFARSTYEFQAFSQYAGKSVPAVLVSEGWRESEEAVQAAGLSGYLAPGYHLDLIPLVIQVVLQGDVFRHIGKSESRPIPLLTERQKDVLLRLVHGFQDEELARSLRLSPATVRHHMEALFEKLSVCRRTELIAWGCAGGFRQIEVPSYVHFLPSPPNGSHAEAEVCLSL